MDADGEESAVHGDGVFVVEADLAEDQIELGVPGVRKADLGAPPDVVVCVVIPVEVEVDLRKHRLDGTAGDAEEQTISGLVEVDAEFIGQPAWCEGVLATAVDEREEC